MFKDICGIAMMAIGAIMITTGFLAIRKIVSIEV
jgi:hypothetical protein